MSEAYQLLGNRLLVRMNEVPEKIGNVILPDSARKNQDRATVVAVGTGKDDKEGKLIPPSFFPGQIVVLERNYGPKVRLNDEDLLLIKADDVIAIVG